jgi:NADPH2:quinone reductase
MIERGQQVRTERGVVLDHREMAHALHDGEARAGDRAATFEQSLNCLRRRGLLVSYGSAGGVPPPLEIFRLNRMGSLYLTSAGLADYIHDRVEMLARAHDLFEAIRVGAVHVEVRRRYPLAQAERAHRDLEDRRTTGSSILIP